MSLPVDEVVLTLGGESLKITENYEIRAGIFDQPSAFAIRLGSSQTAAKIISRYPSNTPFQLLLNGQPAQSGFTDGFTTGDSSGATMVTIKGRDLMARVTKAYVRAERGFSGLTYAELNEEVLSLCFGYTAPDAKNFRLEVFPYTRVNGGLFVSNDANRLRMTGKQRIAVTPPETDVDFDITQDVHTVFGNFVEGTSRDIYKTLKVNCGTKWYENFLKPQNDRVGLFLWAAAAGGFILSTPNGNQSPSYQITRLRNGEKGLGKVKSACFENDTANRYSKWVVVGRGGPGRNFGHPKTLGEFVDPEIAELFGSEDGAINTFEDNHSDTVAKCQFLARRRCAEANREGWRLTYTVSGHSTEGVFGRANWAQDTVVAVDDRELGIAGNFYLESFTMNRNPETTTTLRLMRPKDLLFGEFR